MRRAGSTARPARGLGTGGCRRSCWPPLDWNIGDQNRVVEKTNQTTTAAGLVEQLLQVEHPQVSEIVHGQLERYRRWTDPELRLACRGQPRPTTAMPKPPRQPGSLARRRRLSVDVSGDAGSSPLDPLSCPSSAGRLAAAPGSQLRPRNPVVEALESWSKPGDPQPADGRLARLAHYDTPKAPAGPTSGGQGRRRRS